MKDYLKSFAITLVFASTMVLSGYVGAWWFCNQTALTMAPEQPVMTLDERAKADRAVLISNVQEDYEIQETAGYSVLEADINL